MKLVKYMLAALIGLSLLGACKRQAPDENRITVTIEPQRFFADRIGGDRFIVQSMVAPGQNPESYDPTPQQMISLGKSRAYFKIGYIGFELVWMERIRQNNPQLNIFDLSENMPLIQGEEHDHDHEAEDHHHHHGGIDPHIWSSFEGGKAVAHNTLNAFIALDGEHADEYRTNYEKLLEEIETTEQQVREILAPLKGTTFIIYHPALTYFAQEFGLNQLCIENEGKEPTPQHIRRLIDAAKESGAKVAFIQQEFDKKNAELIAREAGCKLVVINPLAYEWLDQMVLIAQAFVDGHAD